MYPLLLGVHTPHPHTRTHARTVHTHALGGTQNYSRVAHIVGYSLYTAHRAHGSLELRAARFRPQSTNVAATRLCSTMIMNPTAAALLSLSKRDDGEKDRIHTLVSLGYQEKAWDPMAMVAEANNRAAGNSYSAKDWHESHRLLDALKKFLVTVSAHFNHSMNEDEFMNVAKTWTMSSPCTPERLWAYISGQNSMPSNSFFGQKKVSFNVAAKTTPQGSANASAGAAASGAGPSNTGAAAPSVNVVVAAAPSVTAAAAADRFFFETFYVPDDVLNNMKATKWPCPHLVEGSTGKRLASASLKKDEVFGSDGEQKMVDIIDETARNANIHLDETSIGNVAHGKLFAVSSRRTGTSTGWRSVRDRSSRM